MLEEYAVPGAGEYDVAGIQCESHVYPEGAAYFLRAEDLVIAYFTGPVKEATKVEGASNTAVLVLDVRSNETGDDYKTLIKAMEPSYVFVRGAGATPEFRASLGLAPFEGSTLKVTVTSLPLEGTQLVAAA